MSSLVVELGAECRRLAFGAAFVPSNLTKVRKSVGRLIKRTMAPPKTLIDVCEHAWKMKRKSRRRAGGITCDAIL